MRHSYHDQPIYIQAIINFLEVREDRLIQSLWSTVKAELGNAPELVKSTFFFWVYNNIYVTGDCRETYQLHSPGFEQGQVYYQLLKYNQHTYTKSLHSPIEQVDIDIPDYSELIGKLETIVAQTGYYFLCQINHRDQP